MLETDCWPSTFDLFRHPRVGSLFLYLGSFLLPLTAFGFSPGLVPWTVGKAIDGEGFLPVQPTLKAELSVESHLAVPRREPYCPREGARDNLKDVPSTSSQQSPYFLTATSDLAGTRRVREPQLPGPLTRYLAGPGG
ncbi:hypothetical protein QR685DRAFT_139830 [Neurospora intermedia]|uniref:Uncharacterized protein n=1 Tax=Neurospora intermedia TaxID=5142 RepID=A0ABR3CY90_NEUIN